MQGAAREAVMSRRQQGIGRKSTVALLLVIAAAAWAFANREDLPIAALRPEPAPALAAVSAPPPGEATVAALGRLQPKDGVRRVAGPAKPVAVVGKLLVDKGDKVESGQVIALLDEAEMREASVARAEALLANAKTELARNTALRAGNVVAAAVLDRLRFEHAAAAAELRLARAELARNRVSSPIDGQVIDVHARDGERVGPEGIVEIGQTQAMYAVAEVYETDIGRVRLGARAQVASPALPRDLAGTVDRIGMRVGKLDALGTDPAAKTDARVVEVEVRLDDGDSALAASLTHLQVEVTIAPPGA
jgi:HlyD family secretion protein